MLYSLLKMLFHGQNSCSASAKGFYPPNILHNVLRRYRTLSFVPLSLLYVKPISLHARPIALHKRLTLLLWIVGVREEHTLITLCLLVFADTAGLVATSVNVVDMVDVLVRRGLREHENPAGIGRSFNDGGIP